MVPAGGQQIQVIASAPNVNPSILLNLETGVQTPVTTDYVTDATLATAGAPQTTYCVPPNGGLVLHVIAGPVDAATLLRQLGLDYKKMEVPVIGRTMKLVEEGDGPIAEILS